MLTASQIVVAQKIFRTIYNQAIAEMGSANVFLSLLALATVVNSDGAEEDYRWLGEMPLFQEWFGDLTIDDLKDYEYTLKNRHFAAAVGIDKNELEDDRIRIIAPRIQSLAERSLVHRARLIHDLILNGTTYLAFDGIAYFSNASGVRVNDNLLAGTISAGTPTIAQVQADIDTVRQAMMAFVDGRGEIVGVVPDTFVVHPLMERLFRTVAESSSDPSVSNSGAINPFKGWVKGILVDPGLSDVNDFYAYCTTYAVKPYVYQDRQAAETELVEQKLNKKLIFKSDYRGNAGLTLPILAAKVVSGVA